MNKTEFQWLGHTSLSLKTQTSPIVFQPFFTKKYYALKRFNQTPIDPVQIRPIQTVFYANPSPDRFDQDSLKYFSQASTQIFAPKSLKGFLDQFFHFQTQSLQDGVSHQFHNVKITPIATPAKIFRFWKWHTEIFHFLIEVDGERTLILSDALPEGGVWDHLLKLGKIDRLIFPISKLSCLPFVKAQPTNWQQLRKMVDFLKIESLTPYAYGSYAASPSELAAPQKDFENQMSSMGLSPKIIWLNSF